MKNTGHSDLLTRNKIDKISESDHLQQADYLEVVKSFARLTYESIYIIDYQKMAFEYVSENPLFLCGHTPEEVLKLGYDFYFKNVPESELDLLTIINNAGFDFYDKLPANERKQYSITYDFHLINRDGKQILINHKLTPLFLTAEQRLWKAMCIVSISHHKQAGNVFVNKQGSDETWQLDLANRVWRRSLKPKLSKREIEILRLHAQGLTINQIADKIFVVPDTVKYYRRRIFNNLQVGNMVEALSYAVSSKII